MISVHISNEKIHIVNGDAKYGVFNIYEYHNAPAPDGSILNGVITDVLALREEIGEVWKANKLSTKGVNLVIDNAPVVGKVMRVPLVSNKKILRIIDRELSSQDGENVLDYAVLHVDDNIKKKDQKKYGMDIYACSVQKSLLQSYVDLFESNGIRITNINLGINSMIKIGHFLRSLREKTYIVITLDGSSFASYLFVNGKYSISSRYRLIYDRGTNLSFMEITQHVSNFLQFASTQRSGHNVENVYFCGLYKDEEALYSQINSALGIKAQIFPHNETEVFVHKKAQGFILSDNIYASGNLI